ncbi:MAG TPA: TIGR03435 family protein [Candidatus Acidoferrum sp.]|nr:TIGR03435 family protein [Candidatus Acidoferrum sp.]
MDDRRGSSEYVPACRVSDETLEILCPTLGRNRVLRDRWFSATGTTEETAVAMLRTALAERLGLKCHFEERQTSVYVLTVPEGGHKLTAAAPIVPEGRDRHMGILKNDSATLTDIKYFLTTQMDRDVINKTNIQGRYRVDLDFSGELRGVSDAGVRRMLPDPGVVIKAMRSLGLNLESRKVPLKFLVVDNVNREPSAN